MSNLGDEPYFPISSDIVYHKLGITIRQQAILIFMAAEISAGAIPCESTALVAVEHADAAIKEMERE